MSFSLAKRSREEDVSETMYKDTNRVQRGNAPDTKQPKSLSKSKVNRICDSFLEVLIARQETNFQNVVTAHVCKMPPDLDAGLSRIAGLRSKFKVSIYNVSC